MAMLEIKDLHVHYGVIHALKGVSMEVNQGEIVALIGANVPERQRCCMQSVQFRKKAQEKLSLKGKL